MTRQFYCQKVCVDEEFSIREWNKAFDFCNDAGLEGEARDRILSPDMFPCEAQCEDCTNIVIEANRKPPQP